MCRCKYAEHGMLGIHYNPSEKYECPLGFLFPIYGKNVPNHQPGIHYIIGLSENSVSHIPIDYHHVPH